MNNNDNDHIIIPCGKGEIILGDPAPPLESISFTFGPAPTVEGLEEGLDCKNSKNKNPEIILGAPCPPIQKICFFEKEKK